MISKIELVRDPGQVRALYEFIKRMPLDYNHYDEWVEKCYRELQLEYKKAFTCLLRNRIIGNLIFQQYKQDPLTLEIKNGRVNYEYRRRKVFTRLFKKVESYAVENGFKRLIADTHRDNITVITTLQKLGFHVEAEEPLYDSRLETILIKEIR